MGRDDVLNIARLLLARCDGAISRDEKGYDVFDAVTVRQILSPDIFGIKELMDEEVEYLRLKLLRYKKQLRKVGLQFNIPPNKIDEALRKLDEPITKSAVIIRGQEVRGGPYGRISMKWVKENLLRSRG